jgi:hypothetical protein
VPGYSLIHQQQLLQELSAALLLRLPELSVAAGLDSSAALLQLAGAPELSLQQLLTQQQQQQQQQQQDGEAADAAGSGRQGVGSEDAGCYWAGLCSAVVEAFAVRIQSGTRSTAKCRVLPHMEVAITCSLWPTLFL